MTELDKFKRRMIRSVARLLHEKKSEDELWEQMKKETGCDCKLLWDRMRALTLKKLRRLLLSDDKSENVAAIARMSLTDWLLFDLVLVHEKIDFIEKQILESNKDMKPHIELFYLVQKFQIENVRSNALADAWTAATVIYNSRGHQCSPMLLQRRWYQLKEVTREGFYNFWFKYRGNPKQLRNASQFKPSRLQAAIARRYNNLITSPFLDWEKMIEERLVILPDEFEAKMRNINFKIPSPNSNDPELILVEPVIETIDLGADSDSDQQEQSPSSPGPTKEMPPLIKIKQEPKDTDINDDNKACDAEMLRAINKQLPQKVLDATNKEAQAFMESENLETLRAEASETTALDHGDIVTDTFSDDVIGSVVTSTVLPQISSVFGNVTSQTLSLLTAQSLDDVAMETCHDNTDNDDTECLSASNNCDVQEHIANSGLEDSVPQVIDLAADQNLQLISKPVQHNDSEPLIINSSDDDTGIKHVDNDQLNKDTDINEVIVKESVEMSVGNIESNNDGTIVSMGTLIPSDTSDNERVKDVVNLDESEPEVNNENIVCNEHAKDAVENLANIEDHIICVQSQDVVNTPAGIQNTIIKAEHFSGDMNFVDDGIEFADDGIVFFDEDDDSNSETTAENDTNLPINLETKCKLEKEDEHKQKFDLKLLLNPIVYTMKIDNLSFFRDNNNFDVKSKDIIDCIEKECKPLCVMSTDVTNIKQEIRDAIATSANDDLSNNDASEESDLDEIPDNYKIKTTSYMFQKPKSRTYNPIQLCKNPDFNTRLKRLPFGFFSSTRNCQLLKSCKPMTIDVNKTFENKLINGMIYFKSSNINDSVIQDVENEKDAESQQTVSVLPSAMAAQSLIDNTIALSASKQTQILTNSYTRELFTNKTNNDTFISERSRVIRLPDISHIRRINQKLQTAEVTPIQVQEAKDSSTADVQITEPDLDIEANAPLVYKQPNVSEVIDVPEKPASEVIEVDKKPLIIPDQSNSLCDITSRNASQIDDFIKQIEATGFEIAKSDPKPVNRSSKNKVNKASKYKDPKLKNPYQKGNKRYYPKVPWLSANRQPTLGIEDSLLTLDTLNKMLKIINGSVVVDKNSHLQLNNKSKKKPNKHCDATIESKDNNSCIQADGGESNSKVTETERKSKDDHLLKSMQTAKKLKINIFSGNRRDNLLRKRDNNDRKLIIEKQAKENVACVISSDDDDTALSNACESIERVVRQTHELDKKNTTASVSSSVVEIVNLKLKDTPAEEIQIPIETPVEEIQTPTETPADEIQTPVEVAETPVEVIECPTMVVQDVEIPTEVVERPDTETGVIIAPHIFNNTIIDPVVSDVASFIDVLQTTVVPALCGSTMVVKGQQNAEDNFVSKSNKQQLKHTVHVPPPEPYMDIDYFIPVQAKKDNTPPQLKTKITTRIRTRTLQRVLPAKYYKSRPNEQGRPSKGDNILNNYQAIPCSCRLPSVSLDTTKRQKHLIIDGSASCALHNQKNANNKHKVLLMNSKNISRDPSERPISLGKNKILLTTVKLPKYTPPETFQNPQVIPAMPLPAGVQLILLPNGELTYFIDPSIQLNAEQMSSIPIIMAAVKQQLDTCSILPATEPGKFMNNDVVDISDDESGSLNLETSVDKDLAKDIQRHTINEQSLNTPNNNSITGNSESPEPTSFENGNQGPAANEIIAESFNKETNVLNDLIECTNKDSSNVIDAMCPNINKDSNDVMYQNGNVDIVTNDVNDLNGHVGKETNHVDKNLNETIGTEYDYSNSTINETVNKEINDVDDSHENVNKDGKVFESDTSTAGRKTILSDLMEMSGISAEDTAHTLQENGQCENNEEIIDNNVMLRNLLERDVLPTPDLVPTDNITPKPDIDIEKIPELTPITSLSELKYACEQEGGQFFKLHLDTGVLIPINVCVKKHTKQGLHTDKKLFKPIAPKQVMIDLTDDNDIIVQENQSSKPMIYNNILSRNNYKSLLKSTGHNNRVKPLKIFKSVHANIIRKQYRNNLKQSKVCVELDNKKSRKRKQRLSQIEAKIDLVDSDAPMEEEYLVDNFDDSGDSSDDETLASKAKRKRANETFTTANESDKVDCKSNKSNALPKKTFDKSEVSTDNTEAPCSVTQATATVTESSVDIVSEKESGQLPCDNDMDGPLEISFLSDDDFDTEGLQEDCILGV